MPIVNVQAYLGTPSGLQITWNSNATVYVIARFWGRDGEVKCNVGANPHIRNTRTGASPDEYVKNGTNDWSQRSGHHSSFILSGVFGTLNNIEIQIDDGTGHLIQPTGWRQDIPLAIGQPVHREYYAFIFGDGQVNSPNPNAAVHIIIVVEQNGGGGIPEGGKLRTSDNAIGM